MEVVDFLRNRNFKIFTLALEARFLHPRINKHADIKLIAKNLEESCYLATSTDDYFNRNQYILVSAELLVHIAPYFYCARHSLTFRKRLQTNNLTNRAGQIVPSVNVVKLSAKVLWPEIFDNQYLSKKELGQILDIRSVEIAMCVSILQDQTKPISLETMISESQNKVCSNTTSQAWQSPNPQLLIKNRDETKICMQYETFIKTFAKGETDDLEFDPSIVREIRIFWSKEIKMAMKFLSLE